MRWIDPARKPFVGALILGAAFAVMFGVAYPPFDLWWMMLIAPLPMVLIAHRTKKPWRSALAVGLATMPMWWWHHAWIGEITGAGMPALVVYLGMWSALFIVVGSRIARRWPDLPPVVWAPIAWTTVEILRGEVVMHGYSWFMVGEPLIRMSGPIGVYLTGFLVVAVQSGVLTAIGEIRGAQVELTRKLRLTEMIPGFLVAFIGLGILIAIRVLQTPGESPGEVCIGIVQTNIPQSNKVGWSREEKVGAMEQFLALTREVAAANPPPDIIVWPETMFPGDTLTQDVIEAHRNAGLYYRDIGKPTTWFHDQLVETQRELGIPMIIGALAIDGYQQAELPSGGFSTDFDAYYNSAFVVTDGRVQEHRYDKTFLTPFGEVMPYISAWPWLEKQLLALGANGLTFDLSAGEDQRPLDVPLRDGRTVRIAPQICFEATMPSPVRRLVFDDTTRRADVIVQITNDGWFGTFTPGKEHHALLAQWRAAELGTPVVRVANTGLSGSIDAAGRDITDVPVAARDRCEWTHVFTVTLPDPDSATLFALGGWMIPWVSIPICAGLMFLPRRKNRTLPSAPASDRS